MSLKLDHVPALEGLSTFNAWERAIARTLKGEGLYGYVADNDDPLSPWCQIPCPPITANASAAQRRTFNEWWQGDSKAKDIIERRLSPIVASIVPNEDRTTSRDVWLALKSRFGRVDVIAQYDLRSRVTDFKLQDHTGFDAYIGDFKTARAQFIAMGVAFTEDEMVHLLIRGLPEDLVWSSIKAILTQMAQDHADMAAVADVPPVPDSLLNRIVSRISTECNRLASVAGVPVAPPALPRPGSEYVNYVAIPRHAKNPNGVICTNCRSSSHDRDHCYSKGGGLEGQQPRKASKEKEKEIVAFIGDLSC